MNEIIREDINWLIDQVNYKQFDKARILITGACGAIARYLVHFFMELYTEYNIKCEVHALVRDIEKAQKVLHDWIEKDNFYLHIGNVENSGILARDMTYIFHAAGISATQMFETNPVDVISANVKGTETLLRNVIDNERLKKIIFFSSGAVYGDLPNIYATVTEDIYYSFDPFSINACYVEGKRMGELLCYSYWKQYGVPTAMVRIGHSYGPGINLQSGHIYSDIVKALVEKRDITIRNPHVTRPFTYVRDTIWGILLVALKSDDGNAYNLWNINEEISVGRLVHILFNHTFKELDLKIYYQDKEYICTDIDNKEYNMERTDTKKIEKLGWMAKVNIEDGFSKTVQSFNSQ